eukprot:c14360_g1_i1 orf=415-1611(+)
MKKVQKLSKEFPLEIVGPDSSFPIEAYAESNGNRPGPPFCKAKNQSFESFTKAASDDSCGLKRKSMSLNAEGLRQSLGSAGVFYNLSLEEITSHRRKLLRKRLRLDLEQVRSVYHRLEARELELKACDSSAVPHEIHRYTNATKLVDVPVSNLTSRPSSNKLNVSSEIVSGKDKKLVSDKMKSKSVVAKRSLQVPIESQEQKGQKGDISYIKKLADLMRQCGMILRKLMCHRHGWVFNEPVDVVKFGLHDYCQIIRKPMDLGTIKAKLEGGKYTFPLEFAQDVRLTFLNATTYNPPGHDVHAMADLLLRMFEDRWASVEEKLKVLKLCGDSMVHNVQGLQTCKTFLVDYSNCHQETVGNSFASLASKRLRALPPPPKNNQPKHMVDRFPKQPMNFEEK